MKNIIKSVVLTAGVVLFSGCNSLLQPTPIIQNEESESEVVVHGDDVKKAVAVLIYKVKELETSYPSLKATKEQAELTKQKPQESQVLTKKIELLEGKVLQLSQDVKNKENINTGKITESTAGPIVKSLPSEYDSVIKDFANERDLK